LRVEEVEVIVIQVEVELEVIELLFQVEQN
jgi:hypothetical protein